MRPDLEYFGTCPICDRLMIDDEPAGEVGVFSYGLVGDTCAHAACLEALASDIATAQTVEELRDCIDRYYIGNSVGGSLHIVLDDYNYEDESIRFCIDEAEKGWLRNGERTPPDTLGAALGRKLLTLSLEERASANDARSCVLCGHALSLHSWRAPDGRWGYSSQGTCALADCDCVDGRES